MGMTNRQFQGFIRTILALIKRMLENNPNNPDLIELQSIFQYMLEDGTD